MNSWTNEHFGVPNMMNIGTMMPGMAPPFVPPYVMTDMSQMNQMGTSMAQINVPMNQLPPPMSNQFGGPLNTVQPGVVIGPIQPQIQENDNQVIVPDTDNDVGGIDEVQIPLPDQPSHVSRDKSDRRDRDRERTDKGRRRSRSRNRDRSNRGDRGDRTHREKHSKWDSNEKFIPPLNPPNVLMQSHPSSIMQYGNVMAGQIPNHMMQQMDMSNLPQMVQFPGMNIMQNMMMITPQMQMANQPIYFSTGVILPPIHSTTAPPRRERPNGCRTIFVGGIPKGTSENIILEIFQRFGPISEVKLHKGVCHVRFEKPESVEMSFIISGSRMKAHDQNENEATTLIVEYALNREDQNDYEKNKRKRETTPPRVEPFTSATFSTIGEKIKSDSDFSEAAPSLAAWLERGECNKKNANTFYSLIQASNNHVRRLFNEKMQIDEEFQSLKNTMRDKSVHILLQFEQIAKILTAAKHQRVSDHFSKQQRRNIEMWLKMTEELDNIKDEFNTMFDEDEIDGGNKNFVSLEKYERLRTENENLTFELEGYKNEAHLAKSEAERKFEKFKAHFIAQQALQNKQVYPPLPSPPMPKLNLKINTPKPKLPPIPDDGQTPPLDASDAKLIGILSAFLMVHPRGASLEYLVSYVKSMVPNATQTTVHNVLNKYNDVFCCKTAGVGACIEHKWCFVIFDSIKLE